MSQWYTDYTGKDWENMCHVLLHLKHGEKYESLTDKGGDHGIDGWVEENKLLYQAYGQEFDNKDPEKGIKDKISKDLKKLKEYESEIIKIVGDSKIDTWMLLLNKEVPSVAINKFIATKEVEVRSQKISFISQNFNIVISTPKYFELEHIDYKRRKDDKINVETNENLAPELDKIRNAENFVNVFNKYSKVADTKKAAEQLAYSQIVNFIKFNSQLDAISKQEPEYYSAIMEVRDSVEKEAVEGSLIEGSFTSFTHAKSTLETRINSSIANNLTQGTIMKVLDYTIADWFVRCPLDFKDKKND